MNETVNSEKRRAGRRERGGAGGHQEAAMKSDLKNADDGEQPARDSKRRRRGIFVATRTNQNSSSVGATYSADAAPDGAE